MTHGSREHHAPWISSVTPFSTVGHQHLSLAFADNLKPTAGYTAHHHEHLHSVLLSFAMLLASCHGYQLPSDVEEGLLL